MKKFFVKVRTATQIFCFSAIGQSSFDVWEAANDQYGLSAVTVLSL